MMVDDFKKTMARQKMCVSCPAGGGAPEALGKCPLMYPGGHTKKTDASITNPPIQYGGLNACG